MDVLHYSNFVEPVRVATYLSHPLRTAAPYAPKAGVAVPWLFKALRNLFAAPSGCFAASIEDGRRAVAAAERRVQDVAVRRVEHGRGRGRGRGCGP